MARRSKNQVELIGFIGNTPELKTKGEQKYVRISLATTETWGSGDDRKERTEWHSVVAFGAAAENLVKYTRKGTYIQIDGRLRYNTRQIEGETAKRIEASVFVDEFILLDRPETQQAPAETPPANDFNDDDAPF